MHLTPLPKSDCSTEDMINMLFNPISLFVFFFIFLLGMAQMDRDRAKEKNDNQPQVEKAAKP